MYLRNIDKKSSGMAILISVDFRVKKSSRDKEGY